MLPQDFFIKETWHKPTGALQLSLFRIILGATYCFFFLRLIIRGKFEAVFIKADFHFRYDWLPAFPDLPDNLLWALVLGLVLASFLVALNLLTRWAFAYVFIVFGFLFFSEKAFYNNHYFLLWLLSFLGVLVFSNNGKIDPRKEPDIQFWKLWVFQLQILIVYFFGGIAKFNSEWLNGNTIRSILDIRFPDQSAGLISSLSDFMTFSGILFDLSIPFLLLYKPTRKLAFLTVIVFNISNHFIFEIGIFPFLMIGAMVLFLEPKTMGTETMKSTPKWVLILVLILFSVQVLIPFRHWIYPKDVIWTEEGYFFSWRMISSIKKGKAQFRVIDKSTGDVKIVKPEEELNPMQIHALNRYPELAVQYAKYLKGKYHGVQNQDILVNGKIQVKMNKRPFQFVFDPNLDLGSLDHSPLGHNKFILPLK